MSAIRALLGDRRRRQHGGVLSGVLIMTAFIAIISAALMTELDGNLLLSQNQMNRMATEATVNSATEMALNQLQTTALPLGCPPLNPVTLNGRTAAVSYLSCWPTSDVRSGLQFRSVASAAFGVEGTHSVIPAASQDLYVVGDATGRIYSYQFGTGSLNWSANLGSAITGPPIAMQDASCQGGPPCPDVGGAGGSNADITYLVPIAGGGASGCSAIACVELLGQDVPAAPDVSCYMQASAAVISRPAAGQAFPQFAYFGDAGGTLHVNSATEFSCAQQASATNSAQAAIVAGPIVFANSGRDEIYVVTSKAATSQLLRYEYSGGSSLALRDTIALPFSSPVGIAVENNAFPARFVITFLGGGVEIFTTSSTFDPQLIASAAVGTGMAGAPYWCTCPGGPQIGVTSLAGAIYVLDTNLNVVASYTGAIGIHTAPVSDGVGEWFYGADDGYLYELQLTAGQSTLVQVARYGGGGLGLVGSVQVSGCATGICIYLNTSTTAYIVLLDARAVRITACLSSAPPACTGVNPRLWTQVEVGANNSPRAVHVQGWSYYSP